MKLTCDICPHQCSLGPGQTGFCRARKHNGEKIVCENYGKITSIALDPIEKKPLHRFYPGSNILSVGSYGCNFSCPFCQNFSISMAGKTDTDFIALTPEELVRKAKEYIPMGNIGIAFTYNEPLIGYEFVRDCARLCHESGMKSVLVTNGYISESPLLELLPWIDAMNIDLKGFTDEFYQKIHGGLDIVKNTIRLSKPFCHIEITTLVIPGENDSVDEIEALAEWIAEIDREIPLHLTRFFPRYQYGDREAMDVETMYRLVDAARGFLKYVYAGNC